MRIFNTLNNLELVVLHRKSAIIFEINNHEAEAERFNLKFDLKTFKELLGYIEEISNESWKSIQPKEATSMGNDYYEYYDRVLDNNGYLKIKESCLIVDRPSLESNKLYQFNKGKIESFIYDFRRAVE